MEGKAYIRGQSIRPFQSIQSIIPLMAICDLRPQDHFVQFFIQFKIIRLFKAIKLFKAI